MLVSVDNWALPSYSPCCLRTTDYEEWKLCCMRQKVIIITLKVELLDFFDLFFFQCVYNFILFWCSYFVPQLNPHFALLWLGLYDAKLYTLCFVMPGMEHRIIYLVSRDARYICHLDTSSFQRMNIHFMCNIINNYYSTVSNSFLDVNESLQ